MRRNADIQIKALSNQLAAEKHASNEQGFRLNQARVEEAGRAIGLTLELERMRREQQPQRGRSRTSGLRLQGLNSLKGGYIGNYTGTTTGATKGDTKSLDYSSCRP